VFIRSIVVCSLDLHASNFQVQELATHRGNRTAKSATRNVPNRILFAANIIFCFMMEATYTPKITSAKVYKVERRKRVSAPI